jgi:hypothetical protein
MSNNHELFNALLDYYNKDLYRFEFKSIGARNNALAPGEERLRLRPGGGPEGLRGLAPQARQVCPYLKKLRGLQGDRERAAIPDERPGSSRGGSGPGRENS